MIIPPTDGFAFVPNSASNNVAAYQCREQRGADAGDRVAVCRSGLGSQTGAVDTRSKFAYVTNPELQQR